MTATDTITLFHAPNSRSTGALTLLEELGAPYDLHVLNIQAGEQRQPAYLSVNPMGKVPAILHGDALVTEQVAIYIYLADLFPQAGLAPALNDKRRGPVFALDRVLCRMLRACARRQGDEARTWPDNDVAIRESRHGAVHLDRAARGRAIYARSGFPRADVLWGGALHWMTAFGLVSATPLVKAYIERVTTRPAFVRAKERDSALAAQQKPS